MGRGTAAAWPAETRRSFPSWGRSPLRRCRSSKLLPRPSSSCSELMEGTPAQHSTISASSADSQLGWGHAGFCCVDRRRSCTGSGDLIPDGAAGAPARGSLLSAFHVQQLQWVGPQQYRTARTSGSLSQRIAECSRVQCHVYCQTPHRGPQRLLPNSQSRPSTHPWPSC